MNYKYPILKYYLSVNRVFLVGFDDEIWHTVVGLKIQIYCLDKTKGLLSDSTENDTGFVHKKQLNSKSEIPIIKIMTVLCRQCSHFGYLVKN